MVLSLDPVILSVSRRTSSLIEKTWQKKTYKQLNKITTSHTSILQKFNENNQIDICPSGLFFATFPYHFHHKYIFIPETSIGYLFRYSSIVNNKVRNP